MTPDTVTVEPLDQPDPWGLGTGDDDQPAALQALEAIDEPIDEPVDAADAAMFAAAMKLPGAPAFLASTPLDAAPAPLPATPLRTTPLRALPGADALLNLPFSRQMAGVMAVFAAVIVAQAFYIGFSLTGEASARPDLGEVAISSQPSGAQVRVDGAVHGTTPLTLPLSAGHHALEVVAGGGAPVTVAANVVAGQRVSHHVVLGTTAAPTTGALRVDTGAAAATVHVDGVEAGPAPLVSGQLAAGTHTVRVDYRSGASIERQVTVPAGETLSLVLEAPLARAAIPAGPVSGWVHVESPFEVEVRHHGELIGTSASARIMLAAGAQTLELVNSSLGFRSEVKASVAPGRVATLRVDSPRVPVAINAQPWAEVLIDGRVHGDTPLAQLLLPIGVHQVVLRHPELGEHSERVTVRATGVNRVAVDLRKVSR